MTKCSPSGVAFFFSKHCRDYFLSPRAAGLWEIEYAGILDCVNSRSTFCWSPYGYVLENPWSGMSLVCCREQYCMFDLEWFLYLDCKPHVLSKLSNCIAMNRIQEPKLFLFTYCTHRTFSPDSMARLSNPNPGLTVSCQVLCSCSHHIILPLKEQLFFFFEILVLWLKVGRISYLKFTNWVDVW